MTDKITVITQFDDIVDDLRRKLRTAIELNQTLHRRLQKTEGALQKNQHYSLAYQAGYMAGSKCSKHELLKDVLESWSSGEAPDSSNPIFSEAHKAVCT